MIYTGSQILPSAYDGQIFGDNDQLEIIGWSGESQNYHKFYIVECSICKQDSELYGRGLFTGTYSNIRSGSMPCGCSNKKAWTEQQQLVRVKRACEEKGYAFLGFVNGYLADRTKLRLECQEHGVWETCTISKLMQGHGCMPCALTRNGLKKRIDDSVVIKSFMDSGSFHPDTIFTRSERKTNQGTSNYWFVECPECKTIGEGWVGNLQNGSRPCDCSKSRQTEAYINLVKDDNNVVALKFGVSRNSLNRVYFINYKSVYHVENYAVYKFDTTYSTKRAEIECKYSFDCGIISKQEMPDGYSETTSPLNLEKIVEIYEKHGGIRQ